LPEAKEERRAYISQFKKDVAENEELKKQVRALERQLATLMRRRTAALK